MGASEARRERQQVNNMSSTNQTRLDGEEQHETTSQGNSAPDVTICDDGSLEACTCVWPDKVLRVDALIGISADNHDRRRVIDQCQDCGGEVR
jgi:hypothetical protein